MQFEHKSPIAGGQGIQQGTSDTSQTQTHPQRNTAFLCKVGCETVQEVVMRTCEVFTHLKNVQVSLFVLYFPLTSLERNVYLFVYYIAFPFDFFEKKCLLILSIISHLLIHTPNPSSSPWLYLKSTYIVYELLLYLVQKIALIFTFCSYP